MIIRTLVWLFKRNYWPQREVPTYHPLLKVAITKSCCVVLLMASFSLSLASQDSPLNQPPQTRACQPIFGEDAKLLQVVSELTDLYFQTQKIGNEGRNSQANVAYRTSLQTLFLEKLHKAKEKVPDIHQRVSNQIHQQGAEQLSGYQDFQSINAEKVQEQEMEMEEIKTLSNVCSRSTEVRENIVSQLEKPCEKIRWEDLLEITELNLKGKGMRALTPHDFQGLSHLKVLDLSDNLLTTFPDNYLHHLVNVEVLDFSNNKINLFSQFQIPKLEKLRELNLAQNRLYLFPEHIFHPLVSLEVLNLSGNRLDRPFPNQFFGLSELSEIDLSDCKIYKASESLFATNHKLETIALNKNRARNVSLKTFLHLTNLQHLNLENNTLGWFKKMKLKLEFSSHFKKKGISPEIKF